MTGVAVIVIVKAGVELVEPAELVNVRVKAPKTPATSVGPVSTPNESAQVPGMAGEME